MRRVREIRIEGDLAFIPLSRGLEAVIDAVDVPLAAGRNWYALKACRTFYAVSKTSSLDGPRQLISLHRTICPSTEVTDHRDGNGLNCRRSNLRAASIAQNAMNRRRPANASPGLKGVTFHRQCQAWQAQIKVCGKAIYLGLYRTPGEAHSAYRAASQRLHGEFGRA